MEIFFGYISLLCLQQPSLIYLKFLLDLLETVLRTFGLCVFSVVLYLRKSLSCLQYLPLTFCSQCLDMVRGLDSLISGPEILKQVGKHMLPKDCTSKILEETVYDSILYTSPVKHNGLTTFLCRDEYPFWFCICEHACVPVWGFVHMNACAHRGQKRVLHPLGLKLQANESYTLWVLRIQLRFSSRAESAPISWAISVGPSFFIFFPFYVFTSRSQFSFLPSSPPSPPP